ncbi:MAG: EscU/YscU/HrcU family type III secretion system export apparatus switch protein [Gammaproteobacteria bacterium]|nr:EscU/YscU/HrcU family type III secretion system export apparatus switch protein [Gammaproteobacteria bacterium]
MNKNPTGITRAVALQYDGESAPVVSANGAGCIAEEIIALARQHDIPILEKPELVGFLSQVKPGDEIPENLYVAVAEVIAFAYMLRNKHPDFLDLKRTGS